MSRWLPTLAASLGFWLLAAPPAAAVKTFGVSGPIASNVDGGIRRVQLKAPVTGPIRELNLGLSISDFADQLSIYLSHNGITVLVYRGEGSTEGASIGATFSDSAGFDYPTEGSISGVVRPAPECFEEFQDTCLGAFAGEELSGVWELRIEDPTGTTDGTGLNNWTLFGEAQFVTRSVPVALFFDPAFVDTTTNFAGDAEAENLRALIESFGHAPIHLIPNPSAASFASALQDAEVLILPEIEQEPNREGANLAGALSPEARSEIANFVANGGTFIVSGNLWGNNSAVLNAVFGFSTFTDAPAFAQLLDTSLATPFQHVDGALGQSGAAVFGSLANLPPGATVYEQGQNVTRDANLVVEIPYPLEGGGGQIVWLGNDFFNVLPNGTSDGGWIEILDRAIVNDLEAFVPARVVAVFDDSLVEDAQSANVQASLELLGHQAAPFMGTAAAAWQAALANADALVIPPLEASSDLAGALDPGALAALQSFIEGGGVLITMSGSDVVSMSAPNVDFLNTVFGFSLDCMRDTESMTCTPVEVDSFLQNTASGTAFGTALSTLANNATTGGLDIGSLPRSAMTIYRPAGGPVTVARFPIGLGKVLWYGWDWSDAFPLNDANRNWTWIDALGRGVTEVPPAAPSPMAMAAPEPGSSALAAFALATLLGLRRSRRRS